MGALGWHRGWEPAAVGNPPPRLPASEAHLRALRGSSVSTALSSGWNRKSSTYSPNFP